MSSPTGSSGSLRILSDLSLDAYVQKAVALLRAARLSAQYPSGGSATVRSTGAAGGSMLAGYLLAMGSSLHRGLYPQLEVDARAGFPTLKEWTRVLTDFDLCSRVLSDLPAIETLRERATRDPAYGKQLLKYLYYSELAKLALPPFESMQIRLQRRPVDGDAQFQLTLDKLDARGLPLRCTAELTQRPDAEPLIVLHGDRAEAKRELWGMIYRLVSLDAELTYLQLQSVPGLNVHSVTIGTVGPMLCGSLVDALDWPLAIARGADTAVLTCGVDTVLRNERAAIDPHGAPDRNNDPLSPLRTGALSAEARREYEQTRQRLGYRISKDRKFVADRESMAAIKALCAQAGTSNLVYALPS